MGNRLFDWGLSQRVRDAELLAHLEELKVRIMRSLYGLVVGVVLAGWRSPRLALYVAVKLPLLMLGTTGLVMILNWFMPFVLLMPLVFARNKTFLKIVIPFLIIELVVASVLMSMGMMMLPPIMVSLPFKLMLFVLVDGWNLIVGSMVKSFMGG